MIGIEEIAAYIPDNFISNEELLQRFQIKEEFLKNKIGVLNRSLMLPDEDVVKMCVKAFEGLLKREEYIKDVEVVVVVTQNPGESIPHISALLHKELGLSNGVACFDISLGCSGYVYGLSIIESFMLKNGMKKGLLFTADPYSKIIDREDKNSLLFGDAATVTVVGTEPILYLKNVLFGTNGTEGWNCLIKQQGILKMNGRQVFNLVATLVPAQIKELMKIENIDENDIDLHIFHQGSKYIIQVLQERLGFQEEKVVFDIEKYGNTISSSIPLILMKNIHKKYIKRVLISGFGVGFSFASGILIRKE